MNGKTHYLLKGNGNNIARAHHFKIMETRDDEYHVVCILALFKFLLIKTVNLNSTCCLSKILVL